ncbi:MAG: ABC transporter permease [Mycobacterium sp.]
MMKTTTPDAKPESGGRRLNLAGLRQGLSVQYIGLIAGLVALSVLMSFLSPYFLRTGNLLNIGAAVSFTGIVAAITTAVLISGGLDLSIAAVMALSSTVVAVTTTAGQPWWVAVLAALATGAAVGSLNGYVISYVGVNPFVVTVATQFLSRGIGFLITAGIAMPINDQVIRMIGQGRLIGIPISLVIMVLVFIVVGFLLRKTVFGRHWYAIGGTPDGRMARLAGVPVAKRRFQLYVLSGTVAALAGVCLAGHTTVGDAYAATGLELSILAAVILGGTALNGGRGTIIGTVIGVVLIGVINNGIQLLNLGVSAQYLFLGAVLLFAVVFDQVRTQRELR